MNLNSCQGRAESTTKAGISAGSIIIREGEKQIQPVKQLNRDTKNSLQKLATIFDKEKVQEKQELVNELSKVGNRAIHELAARKGWQEGSDEKILAHSIFGGLLSSLAGGKIATGSLAGGVGEYVNGRILAAKGKAWVEKHPDLVQAISAAVGSAVGAVTGESSIGSNVSLGGTKWNELKEVQEYESLQNAQDFMQQKNEEETEESKNVLNKLASEYEDLSEILFVNLRGYAWLGAESTAYTSDGEIAANLLIHGLYGNGSDVSPESPLGKAISEDLQQFTILENAIRRYGNGLKDGETKNIFASIDLQHPSESGDITTINGKLGYGRIKLGITVSREGNTINYYGQAGDSYNYDYHDLSEAFAEMENESAKEKFAKTVIDGINNGAFIYQYIGALQPFVWTADLNGSVDVEELE